jgi:RNA polymerase sigma-70 factor (ECF subfamily)
LRELEVENQALEQFLRTGRDEDFFTLFEAVYGRVCRYYRLRGLDAMTAEDLAQNVLLSVHRHVAELRDPQLFLGWLFAIARRELIHHWRGSARLELVEYEPLAEELTESLALEPLALAGLRLHEWFSALEPPERELATLAFVEELSYEELAVVFAIPLGTVKWRIYRVRKKLMEIIGAASPRVFQPTIN